jgi:peptide/nickel transport system permease protein
VIPLIVLAVTVVVALGHSTLTIIITIGVLFTPLVARTVRAAVLAEGGLDYVPAARLRGERAPYIMFAEILPNVTGPIIVEATVRLGYAVFAVAGLSFLGFGVQPPTPDWGADISNNSSLLVSGSYWWTVLFPALAIASLVIAINLVSDGITRVLER